jgi:uncharacterized Zn-binding protein involved in type VI secretion
VAIVGCTTNQGVGSTATSLAIPGTSTVSAGTSTTTAETTTRVAIDPAAVLGDSLAASSANYRFTSVVLVGEQAVTTISGVVDGNSVAAEIGTGSSEVSYIRTPEGEWVTGAGGEWVALDGEPPVEPPLAALVDAGGLVLQSGDGTTGVFTGALGLAAGSAQGLPFTLTIEQGLIVEIRYEVDTGGENAQVITTLSEIGAAGPVGAPEGG